MGLLAILLVATAIRLPPLPTKGISFIDEASHLLEGRFIASVATAALGLLGVSWPLATDPEFASIPGQEFPTRWGPLRGEPPLTGRPLHTALLGFAMLVLSERPLAGQMVAAMLGIATVALTFSIGKRLYGPPVGLVAAAALAVSGWHAVYSTQALAESDSLFLAALALRLYLAGFRHRLAWAGFALGCSFLTNPRMWPLLPLLFCAESVSQNASLSTRLATALRLAGGFFVAVLAVAALDQLSVLASGQSVLGNYVHNQLDNVGWWIFFLLGRSDLLGIAPQPRPALVDQLAFYPYFTWNWEGLLWTTLLLAGLAGAFAVRRSRDRVLLVIFLGSLATQTFLTSISARYFVMLALPGALLVGRTVLMAPARLRSLVAGALMLLLILEGTPRATALAGVSSGYREAAALVVHQTGGKHLSNQPPNTAFYTGSANVRWLHEDLDEVRRSVAEGYYLALVALRPSLGSAVPWGEQLEARGLRPLAVLANPYGGSLQNLGEQHTISLFDRLRDRSQSGSRQILVYDLRLLLEGTLRQPVAP